MKCPYIQRQITVEETVQDFDDNFNCTAITTETVKNIELPDCLKENCGAWNDGRCAYRGR
jgi:hypothetical protein